MPKQKTHSGTKKRFKQDQVIAPANVKAIKKLLGI